MMKRTILLSAIGVFVAATIANIIVRQLPFLRPHAEVPRLETHWSPLASSNTVVSVPDHSRTTNTLVSSNTVVPSRTTNIPVALEIDLVQLLNARLNENDEYIKEVGRSGIKLGYRAARAGVSLSTILDEVEAFWAEQDRRRTNAHAAE